MGESHVSISSKIYRLAGMARPSYGALRDIGDGIVVDSATGRTRPFGGKAKRSAIIGTSAAQRSLELISTSVADLLWGTLHVIDEDGKRVKPNRAQRAALSMFRDYPNDYEDGYSFCANMVIDYLTEGNSLIYFKRGPAGITSMHRLVPDSAQLIYPEHDSINESPYYFAEVAFRPELGKTPVTMSNVLHFRYRNFSGIQQEGNRRGFVEGPIHTLAQTLEISGLIDEYIESFFKSPISSMRMKVTTGEGVKMAPKVAEKTRKYFDKLPTKNRHMVYLKPGFDISAITQNALDPSLSGIRAFQIREANRVWGVPVSMLGEDKSGVPLETLTRDYWTNAVKPHVHAILSVMNQRLLNQGGATGYRFAIRQSEMFKGNLAAAAALIPALGSAQGPHGIQTSEWREDFLGIPAEMPDDPNEERVYDLLERRQSGGESLNTDQMDTMEDADAKVNPDRATKKQRDLEIALGD